MPGKHTYRGAKRAREARARWGLRDDEPLPCVVAVAEHCARLPVVVASLPEDIAGALHPAGLVWVNGDQAAVRRRFTVAHELGHRCCGHEAPTVDTQADLANGWDPQEVEANAFAAELLAPAPAVRAMVEDAGPPTLEHVVRAAARFGMSCQAASYRFTTLGLVTAERAAQIARELDEGLHAQLVDALGLRWPEDLMGELGPADLPRLPEALHGTVLHAWLRGELTLEEAACAADTTPEALAGGLAQIAG